MPIYEKASNTELKIIETTEEIVSLATLKAKKSQIEDNLAIIQSQYDKDIADYNAQLSGVNVLISKAETLNIQEIVQEEQIEL